MGSVHVYGSPMLPVLGIYLLKLYFLSMVFSFFSYHAWFYQPMHMQGLMSLTYVQCSIYRSPYPQF